MKEEIKKPEKSPVAPKKTESKGPAKTPVSPKKDSNKIVVNEEKKKNEKKKPENYRNDKKAKEQKEREKEIEKREKETYSEYNNHLIERKTKCHFCVEEIPLEIKFYECLQTKTIEREVPSNFLSLRSYSTHFHVELSENSTICLHCGKKFPTLKKNDRGELHLYLESLGVKDEKTKFHLEVCVAEKTAELEQQIVNLKNVYGEKVFLKWIAEYYKSTQVNEIIKKELLKFIDLKNDNPKDKFHYCFWNVELPKIIKAKLNQYDVEFPFFEKCPMCKVKTQHPLEKARSVDECPQCFSGHFKTNISCGPTGDGTEDFFVIIVTKTGGLTFKT